MCDYSLMSVQNRLAREGEQLVVHRFPTGSLGLASPADLDPLAEAPCGQPRTFWTAVKKFFSPPHLRSVPAVCVPPGACLLVHDIPTSLQKEIGIGSDEQVVFTQITAAINSYRDAVRFRCGREVRLQELREGQRVEVLDLAMAQEREPNMEEFSASALIK
jgi:hypothetical protein